MASRIAVSKNTIGLWWFIIFKSRPFFSKYCYNREFIILSMLLTKTGPQGCGPISLHRRRFPTCRQHLLSSYPQKIRRIQTPFYLTGTTRLELDLCRDPMVLLWQSTSILIRYPTMGFTIFIFHLCDYVLFTASPVGTSLNKRVVDGQLANRCSWPWMVNIRFGPEYYPADKIPLCSGVLINSNTVVTAAHCLKL